MNLRKTNRKKLKDCLETKIVDGNIYTNLVIDGVRIKGKILFSFEDENGKEKEIYLCDLNRTIQGVNCSYIKDYYIGSIKSTFTVDYSDHWITPIVVVNLVKDKSE